MFREHAIRSLFRANAIAGDRPPLAVADDESYWAEIQRAFDSDRTMINLNNGGCSPTPSHVLEAMIRDLRFSNELPVEHMWRVLEPRIESVRRDLASEFGCDPEEMAITRNASEANEIMIFGLDLKRGDEVVVTNQNYGRMITSWEQRARREGIVLKQVSFKVPPPSDNYLVEQFRAAITPRTKVIEVTHITNLTGQIMPVRQIVEMARPLGIEVFVDGAHAFAHFPFKRDDLKCDYYGTSLHKWLLAPVGTGFLYVRKEKQKNLWPLMAAAATQDNDIRKYEEIGTHPAANHNAISAALAGPMGEATSGRKSPRIGSHSARLQTSGSHRALSGGRDRQRQARCVAAQPAPDREHAHSASGVQGDPDHSQRLHDRGGDRHLRRQSAGGCEEGDSSVNIHSRPDES